MARRKTAPIKSFYEKATAAEYELHRALLAATPSCASWGAGWELPRVPAGSAAPSTHRVWRHAFLDRVAVCAACPVLAPCRAVADTTPVHTGLVTGGVLVGDPLPSYLHPLAYPQDTAHYLAALDAPVTAYTMLRATRRWGRATQ